MIEILKPLYKGNDPRNREIGIAEYRLRNEPVVVEIHINHKRSSKHGEGYIYPQKFFMTKLDISKYPLKEVKTKHGIIPMYIVPIVDLKPLESFQTSIPKQVISQDKPPEIMIKQGVMF